MYHNPGDVKLNNTILPLPLSLLSHLPPPILPPPNAPNILNPQQPNSSNHHQTYKCKTPSNTHPTQHGVHNRRANGTQQTSQQILRRRCRTHSIRKYIRKQSGEAIHRTYQRKSHYERNDQRHSQGCLVVECPAIPQKCKGEDATPEESELQTSLFDGEVCEVVAASTVDAEVVLAREAFVVDVEQFAVYDCADGGGYSKWSVIISQISP